MKRRMLRFIFCIGLLALPLMDRPILSQNPNFFSCLQTMAVNAPQVVIGKISEIHKSISADITVDVLPERYLKGDENMPLAKVLVTDVRRETLEDWKTQGSRLLLFYGYPREESNGVNGAPNVINLSDPGIKVLTAKMDVLTDPNDVISATQKAIQNHRSTKSTAVASLWLTDAAARLLGHIDQPHCYCLTAVPIDSDLESWARSELASNVAFDRATAATTLGVFPSEANVALLRPLLQDPGLSPVGVYVVRRAAYDSLVLMHATVSKPILEEHPNSPLPSSKP